MTRIAATFVAVTFVGPLLLAPLPASAAASQPAAADTIEEVVVTAQRREERLQTVPVSVTALTQADLAARQIDDIGTLTAAAPNMSFGVAYDPTDVVIGIRGLSETVPQLGVDPSIGIYTDGVYYALTQGANHAFVDMERVEVLRGPQGTLFGRNTIGGALNIITRKPSDKLEGSAEAEMGNFQERKFTGVLNTPVTALDGAVRLVYQHVEHGGYGRNTFLNTPLADQNENYFRLTTRFNPNDRWEILLGGDYFHYKGGPIIQKVGYYDANPAIPPQAVGGNGAFLNSFLPFANGHPGDLISNYVGGNFYNTQGSINPQTDIQQYSVNLTVTGAIGDWATFKSITGYNDIRRQQGTDTDGTPYDLLDIVAIPLHAQQRSEELQLYGDALGQRLTWITGAYYFGLKGRQGDVSNLFQGLPFGFQNYLDQGSDNDSHGVFGQVTYSVAPQLRLTAGARYTKDTRRADNYDHVNTFAGTYVACGMSMATPPASLAECHLSGKASFSYVPWTVGVDYTPHDNLMLYAKVSKGFRSGGFAQIAPAPPAPPVSSLPSFAPENVVSYEMGEKFETLDHRLRVNADVFYAQYGDIQQSFNIATQNGPITVTENVGKARFQGGELELTALINRLRLNAAVGVVDPKFTEGPNVGLPVTNASKLTYAVSANYVIDTTYGALTFNADYDWRSRLYFFEPIPGNPEQSANIAQAAYGLLGARVEYTLDRLPLTVALWGRNLTDEEYKARSTGLIAGGLPFDPYIAGIPRTYGLSVKYQF